MNDWKTKIAGCFGEADKIFSGHPEDKNRAFELLKTLRSECIGWDELEIATREYLKDKNPTHINEQIKKMSEAMGPWLLD